MLKKLRVKKPSLKMPAKSAKQYRMFQAIAHGNKLHKKGMGSISPKLAKEFIKKTPKKKRSMFSRAT